MSQAPFRLINSLNETQAGEVLLKCCGSRIWVSRMLDARPFQSEEDLHKRAKQIWNQLSRSDYLEAFAHHPRIGETQIREKFEKTAEIASGEQKGVQGASEAVLKELAQLNDEYFKKFKFVFLIFATGKTAEEMLNALKMRILNSEETEFKNAIVEQEKITRLRLEKL